MILIPAPETTLTGASKEWLNDLLKFGWKQVLPSEIRERTGVNINESLTIYEGEVKGLEQCLKVRTDEGLTSTSFWQLMNQIITTDKSNTYTRFKPFVGVYKLDVWIELLATELTNQVPQGLFNSDQKTWAEYGQVIQESNDQAKVILSIAQGSRYLKTNELLTLGSYVQGNANRRLLNSFQINNLRKDVNSDYYQIDI